MTITFNLILILTFFLIMTLTVDNFIAHSLSTEKNWLQLVIMRFLTVVP